MILKKSYLKILQKKDDAQEDVQEREVNILGN
jgi:hypothetical protein